MTGRTSSKHPPPYHHGSKIQNGKEMIEVQRYFLYLKLPTIKQRSKKSLSKPCISIGLTVNSLCPFTSLGCPSILKDNLEFDGCVPWIGNRRVYWLSRFFSPYPSRLCRPLYPSVKKVETARSPSIFRTSIDFNSENPK
jgi:hypothetical protein